MCKFTYTTHVSADTCKRNMRINQKSIRLSKRVGEKRMERKAVENGQKEWESNL